MPALTATTIEAVLGLIFGITNFALTRRGLQGLSAQEQEMALEQLRAQSEGAAKGGDAALVGAIDRYRQRHGAAAQTLESMRRNPEDGGDGAD